MTASSSAISEYLWELTVKTSEGKILRRRMHYDKLTWWSKNDQILRMVATVRNSFDVVHRAFVDVLQPDRSLTHNMADPTAAEMLNTMAEIINNLTRDMQTAVRNLLHLHYLVGRDLQHTCYLVNSYFRQSEFERKIIHRRYMVPLRERLQQLTGDLDNLEINLRLSLDDGAVKLETRVWTKITTSLTEADCEDYDEADPEPLIPTRDSMNLEANNIRHARIGFVALRDQMSEIIDMLHDGYVEDDAQDVVPGRLEAVMAARRSASLLQMRSRAARQELTRVHDPNVKKLVEAWIACALAHSKENPHAPRYIVLCLKENLEKLPNVLPMHGAGST